MTSLSKVNTDYPCSLYSQAVLQEVESQSQDEDVDASEGILSIISTQCEG